MNKINALSLILFLCLVACEKKEPVDMVELQMRFLNAGMDMCREQLQKLEDANDCTQSVIHMYGNSVSNEIDLCDKKSLEDTTDKIACMTNVNKIYLSKIDVKKFINSREKQQAAAPAAAVIPEVSHSKHAKKEKEYYSSPSVESTDPIGNLSASESYDICSEACSAMSNGSNSTYTDCVRACTHE